MPLLHFQNMGDVTPSIGMTLTASLYGECNQQTIKWHGHLTALLRKQQQVHRQVAARHRQSLQSPLTHTQDPDKCAGNSPHSGSPADWLVVTPSSTLEYYSRLRLPNGKTTWMNPASSRGCMRLCAYRQPAVTTQQATHIAAP